MKKFFYFIPLFALYFSTANSVQALSLKELYKFDLSLQYRIMYNASNLPGSGGSTFADHNDYDFFRQRFRLSLDVQPTQKVGGLIELEYRGGWGVGPDITDPREDLREAVVFNRLNARGIRYGYVYAFLGKDKKLSAGILPVSDKVGDTLFSALWDFNVGGISLEGKHKENTCRVAYLRLVDTLSSGVDREGEFYIFDFLHPKFGAHVYFFNKNSVSGLPGLLGSKIKEGWYALTSSFTLGKADLNAFFMINNGKYDDLSHTGFALKGEGKFSFDKTDLSLLCIYTTGSEGGTGKRSFLTPMGILGSGGYWAYTHIFTPQGQSDVNDFGLEIGNAGAGLFTSQAQIKFPEIVKNLDFKVTGGIFFSDKERNQSKSMGYEVGGEFSLLIDKYLVFDIGISYARLGDFYGGGPKGIYEIFSRFQIEF
jgi:hypothetical protein